jgi:hypothetical protein
MKNLAYRYQLLILILWIPTVMLIFKMIAEKRAASVFAGIGFVLIPLFFLLQEVLRTKLNKGSKLHLFLCGEFLFISALPILFLRLLNWDADFGQLTLFGLSSMTHHKLANVNYMFMVISAAYLSYKEWTNEKSQP